MEGKICGDFQFGVMRHDGIADVSSGERVDNIIKAARVQRRRTGYPP